eukprot:3940856-Rhodomonas_salina.1
MFSWYAYAPRHRDTHRPYGIRVGPTAIRVGPIGKHIGTIGIRVGPYTPGAQTLLGRPDSTVPDLSTGHCLARA